jgi:transcriptional regulator with XRE-family HTH domain
VLTLKKSKQEKDRGYERLVEQESLILEATEMISELIQESGENRKELAEKLGRTKGFVTQILSGDRNMTLRTLSDFAFALEHRVKMKAAPLIEQGDGGEALGGTERVEARIFPSASEQLERFSTQADEKPRRPEAAEVSSAVTVEARRYLNARSGEPMYSPKAEIEMETSSGMEKVLG